jgi:hypothetical protein
MVDATEAAAIARAFAARAGALRVVLIVDRPEQEPLMVDCDPAGDVEITDGEAMSYDTSQAEGWAPDVRAVPATAISLDTVTGELAAPLGAIEQLAQALTQVAQRLGGRSVATAEFPTSGEPITLAAREGEPVVLAAGDDEYRLPG